MKTRFFFILWLSSITASLLATDHTSYVNPFIGTQTDATGALSGSTFPGATMPQGMVQLSPETEHMVTWDPCSGYDYNRDSIYGFTHTHLSGTGCTDLIDVSLMPLSHEVRSAELRKGVFGQRYSHQAEAARPGYYMVDLQESGVRVELSATVRTGIHRYTFPQGAPQTVVLDLDRGTYRGEAYYTGRRAYQIIQSQLRVVDDHTIEGFRVITGWAKLRKVYFRAEFSRPFSRRLLMDGARSVGESPVVNGRALRGALSFDPADGRQLTVKVAISPVDNLGARQNMKAEAQSWDFDHYAKAAHDAWQKALSCIDIDGTSEQKTIFYTGLYHVLMQPNTMSDVDGRYMDTNFEIKQMPRGETYHSTFSLWDTFRAAHPLYTLVAPEVAAQFVRDMIRHHQTYGYLPIWDLWGQENYCMIGNHAIPVLSDAILAGLPGVNADEAYQAMLESSTRSHLNSPFEVWEKYGYMPQTLQNTSVSITLEQAFDDWCVAAVAKKLGRTADYQRFLRRSEFYRNLFDEKTGFFRPKDEKGQWIEPFDPLSYENPSFIEGNAWQYMWFVPQNPKGLIELLGGERNFLKKLDENFSLTATSGEVNGNASGFIGQYAHGNEPSHHTVYLYNFAGRPHRTQELVEQVRSQFYNATPCGYAGNDDCGQMSAWYIFSSLGFYPFNAGAAEYVLGTPLFKRATLHLVGGRDFVITAPRKTASRVHVKRVLLNGKPLKQLMLTHQQIAEGGTLQFDM
ncbi:GH92 family glycosyl hydrolase [Xylanibacter brevis]|uniref:GH92 family glycosyl hydrolase n=1 Tax=Xylanibacter brevis TaxID=83231 RepID=UPI000487D630|nr:GH92 family glycosyl hydrolase [Xylanibacter brevis]